MTEYRVGKGRPPLETRFKAGNREYLKRKKKSGLIDHREILLRLMNEQIEFRTGNKVKKASRAAVQIKNFAMRAAGGDVGAAATLLRMHKTFTELGAVGPVVVHLYPKDMKV